MKYQNIIWDWNGTLIDDVSLCASIFNKMLVKYSLPQITLEDYRRDFKFPVMKFYEEKGFDFSKFDESKIGIEFVEEYNARRFNCSLHSGVKETLKTLNKLGIKQSVLSASQKDDLKQAVCHFGIENYFEKVSGLDNIYAASKKELALRHIEELNVDKSKTLMIGDTDHDAESALVMGVDCVLLDKGHYSRERLEMLNVPILSSHLQIPEFIIG